jgi:hypothetical protein
MNNEEFMSDTAGVFLKNQERFWVQENPVVVSDGCIVPKCLCTVYRRDVVSLFARTALDLNVQ